MIWLGVEGETLLKPRPSRRPPVHEEISVAESSRRNVAELVDSQAGRDSVDVFRAGAPPWQPSSNERYALLHIRKFSFANP